MKMGSGQEKKVHLAFEISLLLKGAFAVGEIVTGISVYFVTQLFVLKLVEHVTRAELLEDPRDFVANYLFRSAQQFSVSTRNFTAVYLLSHGLVKLWLIIGLLRGKRSYYPLAIAVFGLFIAYQLYRFGATHSVWLLFITAVDVVVIGLTWHEYRYLQRSRSGPA